MTQSSDSSTLLYRFLGGTVYTSIGTGIRIISGMVATKALAMYLPSSDFGNIVLIEIIAGFLRMISGFSIGVAAIRAITHAKRDEQNTIVDTVIVFRFVTLVLIAPVFLVSQRWVYRLFGEEPVEGLAFLILAFTLVLAYQTVLKQMLQGFFRFKHMALAELGASLLNVILLFILLIWLRAGLVGAVLARILSAGAACVFFYLSLPTKKGLSFRRTILSQMLHFSWPLQINEILTFIFSSFGTLVVATVMTPADVALFAVAWKIPSNIRRMFEAFRTVYFPNLSSLVTQGDYPRAQKMLNATLRSIAFLMTLATGVVFVFQREIILLFYSDQYLKIGPILVLAMLSLSISLVGYVLGNSTVAAGNSKAPPVSNIVNATFTVIGNLTMVPVMGINGAVLAGMIGSIATNPLNVWFLRRTGLIPRVMDYVKPLLFFGVLYGIFWWLQPETWLARLPLLLTFFVASFLFSIITLKDIRTIWNALRRVSKKAPKSV
ncbi:MAG: oligosaccharide flippase family protein [Chloroflexi bacterium]|nr:oligosaccharide flippase family protein [Chloroflexota bacterium]